MVRGPISLSTTEDVVPTSTNLAPQTAEVEISIENVNENVQKELQSAYAIIVRRELQKRISKHLENFLKYFDDPILEELKIQIIHQLSPEDKILYDKFIPSSEQMGARNGSRKEMSYEEICKIYQAINSSVRTLEKNPIQVKNRPLLHIAATSLEAMQPVVAYNIPNYITKAKKILVVQETNYTRRTKKKSFFRRLIERVMPFLKKEDDIVVRTIEEKITSREKVVAGVAAGVVAESFKNVGDNLFEALRNRITYQKELASGKVMDISSSIEQVQARELQNTVSQPGKVKQMATKVTNVVATVTRAAVNVDKGINEWAVAKLNHTRPGAYLEYVLHPGSEITDKTLAEHFSNEFSMASQKEMHDGLVHLARHLAIMYMTANRIKNTGYLDVDAAKYGFKRLEEPAFQETMLKLIGSLGYPAKGFEDLQAFIYATENPSVLQQKNYPSKQAYQEAVNDLNQRQKIAFDNFASALPGDQTLGSQAASTLLETEYTKSMSSKGDENYFYILSLHQQAIMELRSKERIQQAVDLAAREFNIEERLYNPDAQGLTSKVTGQLKSMIVAKMPQYVGDFLKPAREKEREAKEQMDMLSSRWHEKINELHQLAVQSERAPVVKGMSVTELKAAWDESGERTAELALQFSEVKSAYARFHQSAIKTWQISVVPLMQKCTELGGGKEFLNKLLQQPQTELETLKANQAHETLCQQLQDKIDAFKLIIPPFDDKLDENNLKRISPESLKMIFDAMRQGISSLSRKNNITLNEKENLFMMSQAMGVMNTSYVTFDYTKKVYEQIYKTNVDAINEMPSSKAGIFIAQKLGAYLEGNLTKSMGAPLLQFNFYAKQKLAGKHLLNEPPAKLVAPQKQGWWDWGVEKAYNAASYFTPIAVKSAELLAVPAILGVGSYYLARLYRTNVQPDSRSINQAVCDNAKYYIREKVFDSMMNMLPQMQNLLVMANRFEANHASLSKDILAECGLGKKDRFAVFFNNIAKNLGFDDLEDFANFQINIEAKKAEIATLQANLDATWFYKAEPREKLEMAQRELAMLQAIYEDKRKTFAKLPENQQEMNNDLFTSIKEVIQTEYEKVTDDIKRGKLNDGTNYLALIASFNSLIQQVELVQRETIAVELFAPEIDSYIGYDSEAQGVLAQLKLAAREDIKSYGTQLAQKGILGQLTQSIETVNSFSQRFLNAAQQQMTQKLEEYPRRVEPLTRSFSSERNSNNIERNPATSHAEIEETARNDRRTP